MSTGALAAGALSTVTFATSRVFVPTHELDQPAARLAAVIDPGFVAEVGWDPASLTLFPPPGHRLLVRMVCRVKGCLTTATSRGRVCLSCRRRLAEHGLGEEDIDRLPVPPTPARGPGRCAVAGCAREWISSRKGLCRAHADLRSRLRLGLAEFLIHGCVEGLPALEPCEVVACPRQRRNDDGVYCQAHQIRLRAARDHDPSLDEGCWRRGCQKLCVSGQTW